MTFPSAFRMGVFARMDGPSEPFWTPDERLSGEHRLRILAGIVEQ